MILKNVQNIGFSDGFNVTSGICMRHTDLFKKECTLDIVPTIKKDLWREQYYTMVAQQLTMEAKKQQGIKNLAKTKFTRVMGTWEEKIFMGEFEKCVKDNSKGFGVTNGQIATQVNKGDMVVDDVPKAAETEEQKLENVRKLNENTEKLITSVQNDEKPTGKTIFTNIHNSIKPIMEKYILPVQQAWKKGKEKIKNLKDKIVEKLPSIDFQEKILDKMAMQKSQDFKNSAAKDNQLLAFGNERDSQEREDKGKLTWIEDTE